jgi:hypothetical protein
MMAGQYYAVKWLALGITLGLGNTYLFWVSNAPSSYPNHSLILAGLVLLLLMSLGFCCYMLLRLLVDDINLERGILDRFDQRVVITALACWAVYLFIVMVFNLERISEQEFATRFSASRALSSTTNRRQSTTQSVAILLDPPSAA